MALESGRYMETVGWLSVDLDEKSKSKTQNLTFTRRYLDPNRVSFEVRLINLLPTIMILGVADGYHLVPLGAE